MTNVNLNLKILSVLLFALLVTGCNEPLAQETDNDENSQQQNPLQDDTVQILDNTTINAGLDPKDKRVIALVKWLQKQGVTLEYVENRCYWKLVEPETPEEYEISFYILRFPADLTEQQMQSILNEINPAYILNAKTNLAMSYAGYSAELPESIPQSDDDLPKLKNMPVTQVVEKLFKQYAE